MKAVGSFECQKLATNAIYKYFVFCQMRLLRFVHSIIVWLDFRFVKAKIGRNSFAWEEMRTNSIQKAEKPKRNVQHTKHFQPKSV